MVNHNLLKSFMYKHNLSARDMCSVLGVSYSSWYRKVKNNVFLPAEIKQIASVLKLSDKDIRLIFLS